MNSQTERLRFATELRTVGAAQEDGKIEARKIVGKPAVFGVLSEDLGGFRERILPGAFTKTIQEENCKSLWNHDPNYVFGSRKAGTLDVRESEFGLEFETTPPDTSWARDFMASIERGDVDQMSFMFRTIKDRWIIDENDEVIRELVEVRLFEVSPVTFPAYPQTSVSLRSVFNTDDRNAVAAAIAKAAKPEQEPHLDEAAAQADARLFQSKRHL